MSLNAAAVQLLVDKGLSAQDIADVMAAAERKRDNTSAERQARFRAKRKEAKSRRNSNGVTPPIEDNHTPSDISPDGENHSTAERREPFPMPDWVEDGQVWADFLANRKRKRLPNTATAYRGFLDDIARIASAEWPPWRLLQHCTAKGWGGIYDPTNDRTPGNDNRNSKSTSTASAAQRAIASLGG